MCFGMLLWSAVLLWVVSCKSFHGFSDRFVLCRKQKRFPHEFPFTRTCTPLGEGRLSTALSLPSSPRQKHHLFKAFLHLLITVVRCLKMMWKEHWPSATRPYLQLQWLYKALRLAWTFLNWIKSPSTPAFTCPGLVKLSPALWWGFWITFSVCALHWFSQSHVQTPQACPCAGMGRLGSCQV